MPNYWLCNKRLTAALLLLWAVVTFGASYFASSLRFKIFGWPFSFWVAAQGALLIYLAVVGFYGWYMNRLELRQATMTEAANE
jgi:putative solute:sodium symporter small subunit